MDLETRTKLKNRIKHALDSRSKNYGILSDAVNVSEIQVPPVQSKAGENMIIIAIWIIQVVLTYSPLRIWDICLAAAVMIGIFGLSKIRAQSQAISGEQR